MKRTRILLLALATVVCCPAMAQWEWIGSDGHKVFSDRAPPADIPEKNILKRPGNRAPAPQAEGAPEPAPLLEGSAPPVGKATGGLSKELETRKKKALEAEAAKRKAEDDRVAAARAENCTRAKQAKATYESGVRIARFNAAGEREFMDPATIAAEQKRVQGIVDRDCK